jgi:hypothetical protein
LLLFGKWHLFVPFEHRPRGLGITACGYGRVYARALWLG